MRQALGLTKVPDQLHPPEGGPTPSGKKGVDALLGQTVSHAKQRGLIPPKPRGAIDATGYETHHASRYYVWRQGKQSPKPVLAQVDGRPGDGQPSVPVGPRQPRPQPGLAAIQAHDSGGHGPLCALDTLLGDRGYDAEHNHAYGRERLKIRSTVFPHEPGATAGGAGRRPNTAGKCGSGSADGRGGPATGGSTASAGRSRAASRGRNACSARPYGPANGSARRKKSSCGC